MKAALVTLLTLLVAANGVLAAHNWLLAQQQEQSLSDLRLIWDAAKTQCVPSKEAWRRI